MHRKTTTTWSAFKSLCETTRNIHNSEEKGFEYNRAVTQRLVQTGALFLEEDAYFIHLIVNDDPQIICDFRISIATDHIVFALNITPQENLFTIRHSRNHEPNIIKGDESLLPQDILDFFQIHLFNPTASVSSTTTLAKALSPKRKEPTPQESETTKNDSKQEKRSRIDLESKTTPQEDKSLFTYERLCQVIAETRPAARFDTLLALFSKTNNSQYTQKIHWKSPKGTLHSIRIDLCLTNTFQVHEEKSPKNFIPSSWLFTDNIKSEHTKRRSTSPTFTQVNPSYVSSSNYCNFTFHEENNAAPIASIFASRCGKATELVHLEKGQHIAGRDVYKLAKTYLFGFFPAARPILADMSHQGEIILRLEQALLTGKTYYQGIDNVSLAEGAFQTYYYKPPINQNAAQRAKLLEEAQNFPLTKWHQALSPTTKKDLEALFKKYHPEDKENNFNNATIKTFLTEIYNAYLASKDMTDRTQFMQLLEMGEDLWEEPKLFTEPPRRLTDYFKYLITQLTWNSLIWRIPPPKDKPEVSSSSTTQLR